MRRDMLYTLGFIALGFVASLFLLLRSLGVL